jgi:hypothetical protein
MFSRQRLPRYCVGANTARLFKPGSGHFVTREQLLLLKPCGGCLTYRYCFVRFVARATLVVEALWRLFDVYILFREVCCANTLLAEAL